MQVFVLVAREQDDVVVVGVYSSVDEAQRAAQVLRVQVDEDGLCEFEDASFYVELHGVDAAASVVRSVRL